MAGLSKLERLLLAAVAVVVALAGAANYGAWAAVPRFALATVALAGLAWAVALGTEQLGEHIGPGATGVLQATLGNLPELLVVDLRAESGRAGRCRRRRWSARCWPTRCWCSAWRSSRARGRRPTG